MKCVGISLYPDFYNFEELKQYLDLARKNNFTRVFTCLLLGSYQFENGKKSTDYAFTQIFKYCSEIGIEVAADTTREIFDEYGASPDNLKPFKDAFIPIVRIDGGFNFEDIIAMTKNSYDIKIELNASYFTMKNERIKAEVLGFLEKLKIEGDSSKLIACFNFFPRPDTAHSFDYVKESTDLLHKYGITVGAFVASQTSKKDLLANGHGIPTIEKHRYLPPHIAAQEMFAMGLDTVIIGDSKASEQEIVDLGRISKLKHIEIPVIFNQYVKEEVKYKILSEILVPRGDQAKSVIRSTTTRGLKVEPSYCAPRKKYDITIDNINNYRYSGELQIMLEDLGRAEYANVIGFVHPDGENLIEYLKFEGNNFKLVKYPLI